MTNILEQVAKASSRFTPSNPKEYLALQISRKLSDLAAVRHYAILFERHPEDRLLDIFRRCAKENALTGEHFMNLLKTVSK
jgi:hypothetical protein